MPLSATRSEKLDVRLTPEAKKTLHVLLLKDVRALFGS